MPYTTCRTQACKESRGGAAGAHEEATAPSDGLHRDEDEKMAQRNAGVT